MAEILTSENFKEKVVDVKGTVLVDFFATWCGPCKMIAPAVEQLAEEYAGKAAVYKLDVDSCCYSHSDIPAADPGEEISFRVHLDTKELPKGECLKIVTLTTNSPLRPIVNLFISGTLE